MVHQGASLGANYQVIFTDMVGKCPVAGPLRGSQATHPAEVVMMEAVMVTDRITTTPPNVEIPNVPVRHDATRQILVIMPLRGAK